VLSRSVRSWVAIPALGAVCAGVAVGLAALRGTAIEPFLVIATGLAGAAITAAIRALAGDSPASIVAMVIAPLLAIGTLFDLRLADPRELIAIAAAAWTCVELSRPSMSPLVALLPAAIAAVDPAFVAMLPIAGARVMTAPWQRPRWAFAIPIAAALAAIIRLGVYWSDAAAVAPVAYAVLVASALGPLMATAALAGLVVLVRPRHAEIALGASIVLACVIGARAGIVTPPIVALAALSSGLAIGRFAAQIRLASGQAFAGATAGAVLLLAVVFSLAP
jgi:hypothetical protein